MKRNAVILLTVLLGITHLIAAEPTIAPATPAPSKAAAEERKQGLVKFDLDFPGGTPGELVAAISKASGHLLNAIIPTEDADTVLPPLKMRHVNVNELFNALGISSRRRVPRQVGTASGGRKSYEFVDFSYGFTPNYQGTVDQDTVWSFCRTPQELIPPAGREKVCRFYQLNPYLKEHSVESITTAIETGWKMLDIADPPTMRFHKDTGLLIAVGEPDQLGVIGDLLEHLEKPKMPPPPAMVPVPAPTPSKPDGK